MKKILRLSFGGKDRYTNKIKSLFGSSLIGYWPLNEASGTVAYDASGNGCNANYTGPALGQPGIGDGNTCPLWDGVDDYASCSHTNLVAAYNVNEGSHMGWAKAFNASVWTDGTRRPIFWPWGTARGNSIERDYDNNTMRSYMESMYALDHTPINTLDWFHIAVTWSQSANKIKLYINGVESSSPGVAFYAMDAFTALYLWYWCGWTAHYLILNRPATAGEIAQAALK